MGPKPCMHDFLKSAQWSYCQNVVQVYRGKKKRAIINASVYLERNIFANKKCGRKVIFLESNNQACQGIRGESHIDFRTSLNH